MPHNVCIVCLQENGTFMEEKTGEMACEGNEQCATLLQKLQCRDVLVSVHRMETSLQMCIVRRRACQ